MFDHRRLTEFVLNSIIPHWIKTEEDVGQKGFHERLDSSCVPISLSYQRLTSAARLVFSFGEASLMGADPLCRSLALDGFAFMTGHFFHGKNGWLFSLGEGGPLPGKTRHLYAHAFAILSCATVFRLTRDKNALEVADITIDFIRDAFKAPGAGFYSSLDENLQPRAEPREQNPHMHLFEALIFIYEATGDKKYLRFAGEIASLFLQRFYDSELGTLTEFFDDSWQVHAQTGKALEPGHHFEWAWLLSRWLAINPEKEEFENELAQAAHKLLSWATEHGVDSDRGGIYDAVEATGKIVKSSKRIWPVLEAVKALRSQAADNGFTGSSLYDELGDLLFDRYLISGGTWREHLAEDFQPIVSYLPATTLYHLVMAVRELERSNSNLKV